MDKQLNQLWDDYRDGTLGEADRAAFEAHLRKHEPSAAMFKAESQWLSMIGEDDGAAKHGAKATDAFVGGVVSAWQAEEGVIGRIGWRKYGAWIGGIAAMIAVFLLGALYSKLLSSNTTQPTGPTIVNKNPDTTPTEKAPDAIGLLMASAKDGYSLAAAQPARIRQGFASTAAMLDVSRLADIFDPGVPDPAKFVEPKNGG